MQVNQIVYRLGQAIPTLPDSDPQLILLFGNQAAQQMLPLLQQHYPEAIISGCSTGGEIYDYSVQDDIATITLLSFQHTRVQLFSDQVSKPQDSYYCAQQLAQQARADDLQHILMLVDGMTVNAQEVVSGVRSTLSPFNSITGGVAGDGDRFETTFTYQQQGISSQRIQLIGFYGQQLTVHCGCHGGWDTFGPMRRVTRAKGTRLYEVDGQSALKLYQRYLGDYAKDLPGSGLRFPLQVRRNEQNNNPVVCTVFGIDEADDCLIFAREIPEGAITQLMSANLDRLIDGAQTASEQACRTTSTNQHSNTLAPSTTAAQFALLISCVGRRAVLQQLVDEELETLSETLCQPIPHCGFYSYGEIAPNLGVGPCNLHNQTMTITTFAERE